MIVNGSRDIVSNMGLSGVFSSSKVCRASNGKDVFPNDMQICAQLGITDCNTCGAEFDLVAHKWSWDKAREAAKRAEEERIAAAAREAAKVARELAEAKLTTATAAQQVVTSTREVQQLVAPKPPSNVFYPPQGGGFQAPPPVLTPSKLPPWAIPAGVIGGVGVLYLLFRKKAA